MIHSATDDTADPGADSMTSMREIRVHDEIKMPKRRITEDTVHRWGLVHESELSDSKLRLLPGGATLETVMTDKKSSPKSRRGRESEVLMADS